MTHPPSLTDSVRSWITILLVLWALCAHGASEPVPGQEADIQSLLERAEAIRSSDPRQLEILLATLEGRLDRATPEQRQYVRYLKAYRMVIGSDYAEGIREAEDLVSTSTDPAMQFRAGLLLVTAYAATRNFSAGLSQLARSLELSSQISDRDLRHRGWITAGVLYNQLGQYDLGRSMAERIRTDEPSHRSNCFAGHLIAEAEHHLGQTPGSESLLHTVISDCEAQQETVAANLTRTYLVQQWAGQGQVEKAIAELREHLPGAISTSYPHLIALFHSLLASYLHQLGEPAAAEQEAHRALAATENASFSVPRVNAWRVLYEVALQRGRSDEALSYYRNYAEADRAYLDDVKAREMAYQLAQLEVQQQQHTIALLNKQNQVLTLEQQVARHQARFNRLLIGLLIVLLIGLGYWAWKIKRVQRVFRHLAQIDALTGVHNRHHFHQQAELAVRKCAEQRLPATLVMFDLDHFKSVNDNWGHAAGDWVLKSVADTARGLCRDRDYIGRLGGEEFALLLIGAKLEDGIALAERCRSLIAETDTAASGHRFEITASFGVASSEIAGPDFRLLLAQADNAVYRSKHRGRNQVNAYSDGAPTSPLVPEVETIRAAL